MNFSNVRTMLFTPGNRPERFEKAKHLGADGIVIDLEDAISTAEKDQARLFAIEYLKYASKDQEFFNCLRINSIKTPAGLKDIIAILEHAVVPDALLIPKVEYPAELKIFDALLHDKAIPYIALIETAKGLNNINKIATSSKNIKGLGFGGGDLAADLGTNIAWEPMLTARSLLIHAAAAAGIAAFDVPYLNLDDENNSRILAETRQVKTLGYTGKFSIHPKQIKPIIDTFTATAAEIFRAKHIIANYEKAKENVLAIEGKMIDTAIVCWAQRILTRSNR